MSGVRDSGPWYLDNVELCVWPAVLRVCLGRAQTLDPGQRPGWLVFPACPWCWLMAYGEGPWWVGPHDLLGPAAN